MNLVRNSLSAALLSIVFMLPSVPGWGRVKDPAAGSHKTVTLRIQLEKGLTPSLFDSISLWVNDKRLSWGHDWNDSSDTHTFFWTNVPKGQVRLQLKTVFGDYCDYRPELRKDTLIFIASHFTLLNTANLDKRDFAGADAIQVCYNASGCFQDDWERLELRKLPAGNYSVAYTYDTVLEREIYGSMRLAITPMTRQLTAPPRIIDSLFELVRRSQINLDSVERFGYKCISTSHQHFFLLFGTKLFQFYDFGVCDWNRYDAWKQEFIE